MKATAQQFKTIDLFAGGGGLSAGFFAAGYEAGFAIDSDREACATFALNHPDTDVECALVEDFTAGDLARRVGSDVDVVLGGPSCQGFSTHGRANGWVRSDDARNDLWLYMRAVVEAVRPGVFVMENVPGLMMWNKGAFGARVIAAFESLGYEVSHQILLAADFGVPQRRRRLFIVGTRTGRSFSFPTETHLGGWRRDTLDLWEGRRAERGLLKHLTVWDAIGDLPELGTSTGESPIEYPTSRPHSAYARMMKGRSRKLRDHVISPLHDDHRDLIEHIPMGGTWRDIPPHLLPDRFRGMRRTDGSNLLGRLDPNLPAYTITTQFHNVTTGAFTHPTEDRSLSVREGARLQSFPDSYRFTGSLQTQSRLIGNAVPPLLAQALAISVGESLGDSGRLTTPRVLKSTRDDAPPPSSAATRKRMKAQARVDTEPERVLKSALSEHGVVFETNVRPIEGVRRHADIALGDSKMAIFVDGCFWHGCREHSRPTKSNTKWWADKIAANVARDTQTVELLEAHGWSVVRVWEHEDPIDAADRIVKLSESKEVEAQAI